MLLFRKILNAILLVSQWKLKTVWDLWREHNVVPKKPITRHLPRCWEKILSWAKRWCISSTLNYHQEKELLWYTHTFIFSKIISFIYLNHFKKDTGFGMVASYPKWTSSHLVTLKQFFRVLLLESSYSSSQGIIKLGNRTHIVHLCMQNRKQKTKKRAEEITRILKNSEHRGISVLTLGQLCLCGCLKHFIDWVLHCPELAKG